MKIVRRILAYSLISIFLILSTTTSRVFPQGPNNRAAIDGFAGETAVAQRNWEEVFLATPAPASAREHLRRLTIEPHIAGTKEDYATAVYVRDQLRGYGLDADLKEYEVWLNYPNTPSVLELITTQRQKLNINEAVVPGDPTSANPKISTLF